MSFRKHNLQSGYVLLALLLMVAMLSIGIFTTIERIDFQIKRDREEELIHRGVQYSRAVRKYFKAFGRYPTRIEELENTNNQRFLRHRYKDPLTGKDFKLLRMTDVQMSMGSNPAMPGAPNNPDPGSPGALNDTQPTTGPGPIATATPSPATPDAPGDGQPEQPADAGTGAATPPPPQPLSPQAGPGGAPQVFGGGAIVGVASVSKDTTIRVFNKKNRYYQWQFIYNPMTDAGGLITTPDQPRLALNNNLNQPQNGPGQNPATQGPPSVGPPTPQQNQQ